MNIFFEKYYIIPYLIILDKTTSKEEYLFVGNLKPDDKKILKKLSENLGDISALTGNETKRLGGLYGKNYSDLQKKLRKKKRINI